MSIRLVNVDRETPMLFPADLRKWLPENHLAHFTVDAITLLDIQAFSVNERGSGSERYPPEMMPALLIYRYVTRRMSSRVIEDATYTDVAVRYICGNSAHPDHSVLCRFRTSNKEAFKETFNKVPVMAWQTGYLKKAGGISVDGTKIHANAGKHATVSYQRATAMIQEIEQEAEELIAKAEEAAKKEMEERYREAAREQSARRQCNGRETRAADETTDENHDKKQKRRQSLTNRLTNTSIILLTEKAGNGKHFEQSYNARAAVDVEGMLIAGGYVTNHANDKKGLQPVVNSVDTVYEAETVSADNGFYSEAAVTAVEQRDENGKRKGPEVYCAVEKQSHHRGVKDLEQKKPEQAPEADAIGKAKMARKLKTKQGKAVYKKRKKTVEPVLGIIKHAMVFRQFLPCGLERTNIE